MRISELRTMLGISQTVVGKRLGLKQRTVAGFEADPANNTMKLSTLVSYWLALEADVKLIVSVDGGSMVYVLNHDTGEMDVVQESWD